MYVFHHKNYYSRERALFTKSALSLQESYTHTCTAGYGSEARYVR